MNRNVFIIGEAGCNHNGNFALAKKMIVKARICGADAVKFQTFLAEHLLRRDVKKTAHLKNVKKSDSVFDAMKKLELNRIDYLRLKDIAQKEGIILFTSVFDIESLRLADEIGFPVIKIPSGEIVNLELLDEASRCGRPIIVSTGMATLAEAEKAVEVISKRLRLCMPANKRLISKYPVFKKGLVLMHTVSSYPARPEELNLKAINTLKSVFNLPVGYSDHTTSDEASIIAASLGADMIEKHFTLDKNMEGFDHKASADPEELKSLISKIRTVSEMMGDGVKRPSASERPMIRMFRKAIVARYDIPRGTVINKGNVAFKRPMDGIPVERFKYIDGMRVKTDIKKDAPIQSCLLER